MTDQPTPGPAPAPRLPSVLEQQAQAYANLLMLAAELETRVAALEARLAQTQAADPKTAQPSPAD